MRTKRKTVYSEVRTTLDEQGSVVEQQKTQVIQFPSEPPFIKIYISDLTRILGLPLGVQSLLTALISKMDYENVITLTSRKKQEIAAKVNIKIQTFDNYLLKMVESGILRRIGRGEYQANPEYFSRGEWSEIYRRREDWQLTITYKPNGDRIVQAHRSHSDNP